MGLTKIPPNGWLSASGKRPSLTAAQWTIYEAGWDDNARFRVAVCGRRFGKALGLDTLLPSPDGSVTMGDVKVGDRLFDEAGSICRVVFATQVMDGRPCNRVSFGDGTSITADDEHLWQVIVDGGSRALLLQTDMLSRHLLAGRTIEIAACLPVGSASPLGLAQATRKREFLNRLVARCGVCKEGVSTLHDTTDRLLRIKKLCNSLGLMTRFSGNSMSWMDGLSGGRHRIVSIERVESVPVRCLQVDSRSKLFLCSESYIPTHNTFLMAEELRRAARLAVRHAIGTENEIWYGAPTFLQAKRVMWARIKATIPKRWLLGRPNETLCALTLKSGHIIRLVGLDACDNLRGSGLWFFGGDEWADCRPTAWSEVIRPMLSTARGHALFIGTPKGFDHFRDAYVLGQPGGDASYRSFLFTTKDGGNVPRAELEAAEREMDHRTFRQEYCASFETYAGRVIYSFSRAENVGSCSYDSAKPLHIGMDFNINPMSATVWQEVGHATNQVDEIIMPTSNTDEMTAEIVRRYGRDSFEPGRKTVDHITVYPDPAGAQRRSSAGGRTDISILREKGFQVAVSRSHPPVRDRINVMNRHFRAADGSTLAKVDRRCVKSIEAYERLVYREGTTEPDKSQGFDHLVDASGYYLYSRQGVKAGYSLSGLMER